VSGHLVGSPAFKAGEWGDPPLAGSIPVHLRSFPSLALWASSRRPRSLGWRAMKKLLVLAILVAIGVFAARKLRVD
jgi:hypothetical protein